MTRSSRQVASGMRWGKQAPEGGGGAVAERGAGAGELQGGVLARERRGVGVADEVHAAPDADQPLVPQPHLDLVAGDVGGDQLVVGDHAATHDSRDDVVRNLGLGAAIRATARLSGLTALNLGLARNTPASPRIPTPSRPPP